VLVLAACGGNGGGETRTSTLTGSQPAPETDTAEPIPTSSGVALSGGKFQMPSKNIGCQTGEGVLVCDILSGLNPEPSQKCELDWTGMEMERLGPAQPRCAGDTAYDQSAPVLEYGTAWQRGGFTCVSMTNGLECRNEENHGFLLSRQTWTSF
jgi:hypothetical protein